MDKLEELYQLYNHPKVQTVFKKKGFVDMRFPFEIHNEIIEILCQSDAPKPDKIVEDMKALLKIKADEKTETLKKVGEAILSIIKNPKQLGYRLREIEEYCETLQKGEILK